MNNQKESELLERIKDAANQRQLKAFNPPEVNPFMMVLMKDRVIEFMTYCMK